VILDAIRHEADGGFDYINLHWYYIYQRNWAAVEAATERDMGVFIIGACSTNRQKNSSSSANLCIR